MSLGRLAVDPDQPRSFDAAITKGNVGFQTQEIVLPQVRNFHESSYLRSH